MKLSMYGGQAYSHPFWSGLYDSFFLLWNIIYPVSRLRDGPVIPPSLLPFPFLKNTPLLFKSQKIGLLITNKFNFQNLYTVLP